MVVIAQHDDHRTWGAADGTDELNFPRRSRQIYSSTSTRHGRTQESH